MANVFDKVGDIRNDVKRNNFDWSHDNNFTFAESADRVVSGEIVLPLPLFTYREFVQPNVSRAMRPHNRINAIIAGTFLPLVNSSTIALNNSEYIFMLIFDFVVNNTFNSQFYINGLCISEQIFKERLPSRTISISIRKVSS